MASFGTIGVWKATLFSKNVLPHEVHSLLIGAGYRWNSFGRRRKRWRWRDMMFLGSWHSFLHCITFAVCLWEDFWSTSTSVPFWNSLPTVLHTFSLSHANLLFCSSGAYRALKEKCERITTLPSCPFMCSGENNPVSIFSWGGVT